MIILECFFPLLSIKHAFMLPLCFLSTFLLYPQKILYAFLGNFLPLPLNIFLWVIFFFFHTTCFNTGYKQVWQYSLPTEIVCHTSIPPKLYAILLPGETAVLNKWLPAETVQVIMLPPRLSAGSTFMRTDSAGPIFRRE